MPGEQTPTTHTTGESRPPAPALPRMHALASQLRRVPQLDAVAGPLAQLVGKAIQPGAVRDALAGRPLGHSLHPLLTDVPIGSWTSAAILDVTGDERAARRLIGLGVAAALPTAASGLVDWADSQRSDAEVRRVGVVHAVSNVAALSLYGASLAARLRGRTGRGRLLGFAGIGALMAGGHLGGHLSYAKGVGVDATAFGAAIDDWTDAGPADELAEGAATCRRVDGVDVLLVRQGGRVCALADRCSHRGGPLHEGTVADGTVTCPWHGSRFRLDDGSIESGPSPYPQPAYDVRERGGRLELRSASEQQAA